jgi:S1-C subfamily serine protease
VPFTEKDVSRDPAAAQEMIRRSGQRGVPVITADNEVIVGFDRPRLERIAARAAQRGEQRTANGRQKVRLGAAVADAKGRGGTGARAGAYVGRVSSGTPAASAGLAPGDTITAINGRPVHDAADVERVLASLGHGDTITVEFSRDGTEQRASAQL